jgi:hypothetical protein
MQPQKAVDAHNRVLEAQNEAMEDLQNSGCRFPLLYEEHGPDPDPHQSDKRPGSAS